MLAKPSAARVRNFELSIHPSNGIKDATANFAAFKGWPTDGSFSKKLLCGFAKQKGQLKKDGNPMWHCGMKFDFYYYQFFKKDGSLTFTCFEEDFDESKIPEGGSYELRYYKGCPCHS